MFLRRITDYLVYLTVRIVVCVLQAMTIEACHALSRGLAILACDILKLRESILEDNLRHVYPTWSARERRTPSASCA